MDKTYDGGALGGGGTVGGSSGSESKGGGHKGSEVDGNHFDMWWCLESECKCLKSESI